MKTQLKYFSAILITTMLVSVSGCKGGGEEKMNVLFIAVDDLRPALAQAGQRRCPV